MATNPPFKYPPPAIPGANVPMFRGYLFTSAVGTPTAGPPADHINFQFNPNTITVAYAGDLSQLTGDPQQSVTSLAGMAMTGFTTCSFETIFDRTIEVATGQMPNGVFDDVHAIEQVYGIFQDVPGPGGALGQQTASPAQKMTTFVFSNNVPLFTYRGIVTNVGIEYIYFSPAMVPLRAHCAFTMSFVIGQGQNIPGK